MKIKIKTKIQSEKPVMVYVAPMSKSGLKKLQVSRDGSMSGARGSTMSENN